MKIIKSIIIIFIVFLLACNSDKKKAINIENKRAVNYKIPDVISDSMQFVNYLSLFKVKEFPDNFENENEKREYIDSNLRYYSFKDINLRGKVPFVVMIGVMLGFAITLSNPATILFLFFFGYALSGPIFTVILLRRKRQSRTN